MARKECGEKMRDYKTILTEEEKKELFHWEERECPHCGNQPHLVFNLTGIGLCKECAKRMHILYKEYMCDDKAAEDMHGADNLYARVELFNALGGTFVEN